MWKHRTTEIEHVPRHEKERELPDGEMQVWLGGMVGDMIEKCNFKAITGICHITKESCPGEMKCILYTIYYYEEEC